MDLEIDKLKKMRESITIELNKLNYSGHGITELRQEYLGINNLTNEEINKIENEKNEIDSQIKVLEDEIKQINKSRFFICKHLIPTKEKR